MSTLAKSSIMNRQPFKCLIKSIREVRAELFDSYRPEKHYMRGPGPKSYEKQRQITSREVSLLSRV